MEIQWVGWLAIRVASGAQVAHEGKWGDSGLGLQNVSSRIHRALLCKCPDLPTHQWPRVLTCCEDAICLVAVVTRRVATRTNAPS